MQKLVRILAFVAISLPISVIAADQHVVSQGDRLAWKAGPRALPAGAEIAFLVGDPTKEGPYVVRLRFPSGYKIAAHTHPNDENVTVISGTFHIGMGSKLDETKGEMLKPGGFAHMPTGMQHYAWTSQDTIVQLHGIGPSGVIYVNPADDPRKSN